MGGTSGSSRGVGGGGGVCCSSGRGCSGGGRCAIGNGREDWYFFTVGTSWINSGGENTVRGIHFVGRDRVFI